MGMTWAYADSDLMVISSWRKKDTPIISTKDLVDEVGPGHNSFVVDENGEPSGSHGGSTPEEYTVFIGIAGKSVANIDLGTIRNRDVAAIAAAALNIDKPEVWTSEVPSNLFTDRK